MTNQRLSKLLQQVASAPADPERETALANVMVDAVREPLILLDRNLRAISASRSYYELFGVTPAEVEGHSFYDLNGGEWNVPMLRELLAAAIAAKDVTGTFEFEHRFAGIGRRLLLLNIRRVSDMRSEDAALLLAMEDVTLRRQTELLLEELARQKETLLLEIHHRVANSLQIIASILMLKMRAVTSGESRMHLADAHQRVMAVATVQQQLREAALGDFIEIGPYLSRLCASLAVSMVDNDRDLVLHSSASSGTIKSNEAVSFGLIVTELVINAIKHGFPGGMKGQIAIHFVGRGDAWRLSVSDNGVGREATSGDGEHIGLGTSIVEALSRQLKARVDVSENAPGTLVTVIHD